MQQATSATTAAEPKKSRAAYQPPSKLIPAVKRGEPD
jgi:hypothetical protein